MGWAAAMAMREARAVLGPVAMEAAEMAIRSTAGGEEARRWRIRGHGQVQGSEGPWRLVGLPLAVPNARQAKGMYKKSQAASPKGA